LTQESAAKYEEKAKKNELSQLLTLAPASKIVEKVREEAKREALQSAKEEETHLQRLA
jgi:hypothetical protein